AATTLAGDVGSLTACRSKIPAARGQEPGTSDGGAPDFEQTIVSVLVCRSGACEKTDVHSNEPAADGPGDLLRVEVTNAAGGSSCVTVRSAATAGTDLAPVWHDVGSPTCFGAPLVYQGIATSSTAWFFGTRREAAGS